MSTTNDSIIRTEDNGIEYFTVIATGESGMSQRGLARACGVVHKSIQYLEKQVANSKAPKRLKRFEGKALRVAATGKGLPVIYSSQFCSSVVKHYAYQGNETAQIIDEAVGDIGFASFIQGKTGWLPKEYQTEVDARENIDRVLNVQRKTHSLFGNENHKKLADLLNCSRGCAKMANFYLDYVYFDFTPSEKRKLDEKNPVINGARRQTIYSWIEENMMETYKERFDTLLTLLKVSETEQEFKNLWHRTFERKPKLFRGLWG